MRVPSTIKVGLVGLIAVSGSLVAGGVASADYAPQAGDIVSVGGDTPQFELSFLANGDFNGNAGFNSSGAFNRLVPFDATADANGRSAYANGSTLGTPINLNPTVIYRAGTYPVQRNSSSGNALNALLADTNGYINFISSTTLPTGAQQTAAGNKGWGFLHVVQIADDAVKIATTSTTNAPANLSIDNLLKIYTGVYTKWSDIPGNSGGSGDTIIPLLPPTSSAIYKSLLADLKTANGNVTPTLTGSVKTVEQNDPSALTSASAPADALVPFSVARLSLYNSGYFHNPATVYPGGSTISAGITLGNSGWSSPIKDYVIFRQSDVASTAPFEPGGTRNWIQTLFSNPSGTTPLVASAAGQALITSAGKTADYNDLGNVSAG